MGDSRSIGVIDSGVGGLSIFRALTQELTNESIVYLGDTLNVPYGIKSVERIKELAFNAAKKLNERHPLKLLVVGCHTVSVVCLKELENELKIPVIGMNEASILCLKNFNATRQQPSKIVILSTDATKNSGVYQSAFANDECEVRVHSLGVLVALIEAGTLSFNDFLIICEQLIKKELRNANAVLLGCTHFTFLRKVFEKIFESNCVLIDAADAVAELTAKKLHDSNLLLQNGVPSNSELYVTDNLLRVEKFIERYFTNLSQVQLI